MHIVAFAAIGIGEVEDAAIKFLRACEECTRTNSPSHGRAHSDKGAPGFLYVLTSGRIDERAYCEGKMINIIISSAYSLLEDRDVYTYTAIAEHLETLATL